MEPQESFEAMVRLAKRVYLDPSPDQTAHTLASHVLRLDEWLRNGGDAKLLQMVKPVVS